MTLSYAGQALIVPTQELSDWIERNISPALVYEFSYRAWPGRNLTDMAFPEWAGRRPIRINSLYWPTGASRWAVGHFLCSRETLEAIRPLVWSSDPEASPLQPGGVLKLETSTANYQSAAGNLISTTMFLLPPRPLQQLVQDPTQAVVGNKQVEIFNGVYLLTLVDQRYYWWNAYLGSGFTITEGTTQWTDLYTTLASAIGITIKNDLISANYGKPSRAFDLASEAVPIVLDSVAYNVGQRIVRDLDGTVSALGYASSKTRINQNIAGAAPRQAGGVMNLGVAGTH